MKMSIYKKTTKAVMVALLCIAMLSSSGAPVKAQGSTAQSEQIKTLLALIQQLQAQLAQMQGSSSVSQCLTLSRALYLGVSDSETAGEVSKLQQFLTKTGHYTYGKPTGYFGPATQMAVQAWQKANSVVSNGSPETTGFGVTGPSTRGAMARSCTSNSLNNQSPVNNGESTKTNPPIADAGTDRTIYLPTNSVTPLDQSVENSEDTTVTYVWTLRKRDSGTNVPVITNAKTLTPTFSSLSAGDYIFRLTVTDNRGLSDTDDMKVTVQ